MPDFTFAERTKKRVGKQFSIDDTRLGHDALKELLQNLLQRIKSV